MKTLTQSKIGGGSRQATGCDAMVHVHRPARRRQDHGAAELRPEVSRSPSQASVPMPLKGVGGTRNCDWWFTDDAVLIDTAGRYTTQDSQPAVDSRRLARLSAPAQEASPAPATQRRAGRDQLVRPRRR